MQAAMKKIFLAAVLCTLAMPALARTATRHSDTGNAVVASGPQQTEGEAANLEKKETNLDAEANQANPRKLTAATHKNHVATTHSTTHPKAAVVQRTGTQQHGTATLKTGQLTTGQSAKLQTKQTTLHRDTRQDRENSGGQQAIEKTKVNLQNKTSNDIRLKKHNARMF